MVGKLSTLFILVFALSLGEFGHSQSLENSPDGSFVALSVADHDLMSRWYSDVLGFSLLSTSENDERKGSLMRRDNFLLEIAQFSAAKTDEQESHQVHGIMKFGFLVADIDTVYNRMKQRADVFFPVVTAADGYRTFAVRDPEGNIIQLFQSP